MKIIINTTTLSGTGVTQVALSFIRECVDFLENDYYLFLSKTIAKELNIKDFPQNFHFYYFDAHPLYGSKGFYIRRQLRTLEREISPDLVFTVFGPACWTPEAKHVTGFANSYYVYPESPFFKIIPKTQYFKLLLMKAAHRYFLKRNGRFFICETEDMSVRLAEFLNISVENIFTVNNTYSRVFENEAISKLKLLPEKNAEEYRLLCLASFDAHKNLTVINEIVPLLKEKIPYKNVKFVLTIDPQKFDNNFTAEAKEQIINLGRVQTKYCPSLYVGCDALFLPTLIESFSANYPEAMKMRRPVLTSNYSFAKSICQDAALYFNPLDPLDIVNKIKKLIDSPTLHQELVTKGSRRVIDFGDAKERAKKYLEVFKVIINTA